MPANNQNRRLHSRIIKQDLEKGGRAAGSLLFLPSQDPSADSARTVPAPGCRATPPQCPVGND